MSSYLDSLSNIFNVDIYIYILILRRKNHIIVNIYAKGYMLINKRVWTIVGNLYNVYSTEPANQPTADQDNEPIYPYQLLNKKI